MRDNRWIQAKNVKREKMEDPRHQLPDPLLWTIWAYLMKWDNFQANCMLASSSTLQCFNKHSFHTSKSKNNILSFKMWVCWIQPLSLENVSCADGHPKQLQAEERYQGSFLVSVQNKGLTPWVSLASYNEQAGLAVKLHRLDELKISWHMIGMI